MSKTPQRKVNYDWSKLKNTELQELYTVTVRNRFAELSDKVDDISEKYEKFVQANAETAVELIPVKKKMKGYKMTDDPRIVQARKEVQESFLSYQQHCDNATLTELHNAKEALQQVYSGIEEERLNTLVGEVENAETQHKHSESWKLINNITGRKKVKQGLIKGNSKEERLEKWYNHFYNLLGKELTAVADSDRDGDLAKVLSDLEIPDGDFTQLELQAVKNKLCDKKQSGPDNISPAIIKRCDFDDIILDIANRLLNDEMKPTQWSEIDLLPIPKSGDLSTPGNYQPISWLSEGLLRALKVITVKQLSFM